MGQILVRNLEDSVIERLKARALKTGKSLEQSVREILTEAVKPSRGEILAEMARIREAIRARHGFRLHRRHSRANLIVDASVAARWFVPARAWPAATALLSENNLF